MPQDHLTYETEDIPALDFATCRFGIRRDTAGALPQGMPVPLTYGFTGWHA